MFMSKTPQIMIIEEWKAIDFQHRVNDFLNRMHSQNGELIDIKYNKIIPDASVPRIQYSAMITFLKK
jgi:hypothetical protein